MGLAELFFFGRIVPILMSEYDFPKNRKSSVLLLQCIVVVLIRSTNDRLRCFMDSYDRTMQDVRQILFWAGLKLFSETSRVLRYR